MSSRKDELVVPSRRVSYGISRGLDCGRDLRPSDYYYTTTTTTTICLQ